MGGHQRGGPVRRDQAPQYGAPALDEFAGNDQVHAPRHRHQGQHRRVVPDRIPREELQVVNGRTGALGNAGHGGGLCQVTGTLSRLDQPVAEHAAALPTHGQDGDLDGFGLSCLWGMAHRGDGLKSVPGNLLPPHLQGGGMTFLSLSGRVCRCNGPSAAEQVRPGLQPADDE